MELGQALVKELEVRPGDDTLTRWMAHYIAELIEGIETASVEARPVMLAKCADTILLLWKHRHELPNGKRPFEELEPILRAIESLDPSDDTPRYFRSVRSSIGAEDNTEAKKWLELVEGLDCSAKLLIRYCLMQASQHALDKSAEWVKLSELAGLEDEIAFPVIRLIASETEMAKTDEPSDRERKLLEDRLARLKGFKKMTDALVSELQLKLRQR